MYIYIYALDGKGALAQNCTVELPRQFQPPWDTPFPAKGCDKITECNKPLQSLPRDKRWEIKCFKCSQIAVLGWGGGSKSWGGWCLEKWSLNWVGLCLALRN